MALKLKEDGTECSCYYLQQQELHFYVIARARTTILHFTLYFNKDNYIFHDNQHFCCQIRKLISVAVATAANFIS